MLATVVLFWEMGSSVPMSMLTPTRRVVPAGAAADEAAAELLAAELLAAELLDEAALLDAVGAVVGLGAAVADATLDADEDPALDDGALLAGPLLAAELLDAGAVVGFGAAVDATGVGGTGEGAGAHAATTIRITNKAIRNG